MFYIINIELKRWLNITNFDLVYFNVKVDILGLSLVMFIMKARYLSFKKIAVGKFVVVKNIVKTLAVIYFSGIMKYFMSIS
jgi:hypothetical protein